MFTWAQDTHKKDSTFAPNIWLCSVAPRQRVSYAHDTQLSVFSALVHSFTSSPHRLLLPGHLHRQDLILPPTLPPPISQLKIMEPITQDNKLEGFATTAKVARHLLVSYAVTRNQTRALYWLDESFHARILLYFNFFLLKQSYLILHR